MFKNKTMANYFNSLPLREQLNQLGEGGNRSARGADVAEIAAHAFALGLRRLHGAEALGRQAEFLQRFRIQL